MSFLYNDCVRVMRRRNNTNSNPKCNADGKCHSDTNTNANTNCHSETYSDATAAANSKDPPNACNALKGR